VVAAFGCVDDGMDLAAALVVGLRGLPFAKGFPLARVGGLRALSPGVVFAAEDYSLLGAVGKTAKSHGNLRGIPV